jgi:hypothetical protein
MIPFRRTIVNKFLQFPASSLSSNKYLSTKKAKQEEVPRLANQKTN